MKNKAMASALLAAALLAAGCGGSDIAVNEQSNLQTQEDALRPYSYDIVYYDGPDLINPVGVKSYPCAGNYTMWGTATAYSQEENRESCYECPPGTVPPFCESSDG